MKQSVIALAVVSALVAGCGGGGGSGDSASTSTPATSTTPTTTTSGGNAFLVTVKSVIATPAADQADAANTAGVNRAADDAADPEVVTRTN